VVAIATRSLNQQVTWWPVGNDGFGGDVFLSPVLVQAFWEDRQETYVGSIDRRERVSKAIVFVDRAVSVGDYLAQGDLTASLNPTTEPNADKVQRYQKFPDLRNLEALHKVIL
jgi:hypothetical protein